ncbi:MAG: GIY-YIG nuclease family protein [Gammaproteobacteria bacterium]|nr:GIY-YIG nuclease family protein [Gammaproteobacteria bacterium]
MLYKKFVWQKKSPLDQSNVVYRVRCSDCPAVHIGETKRTLRTRGAEHLSNIRASNINHSALAEHCITHHHSVALDNFEVIDREPFHLKRLIKESFHIAANLNACNHKQMSVQIANPWLSLCDLV